MRLNADFSAPALVIPSAEQWQQSPESGVDRLMLDRIGDEVARATSVVRYAAGSKFARHAHAMGEEFLVLDGIFSDESGDYPRGTYVRNPPGTGHSPFSAAGCRILVKLRQFDASDSTPVVIDTRQSPHWQPLAGGASERLHLHEFGAERVSMLRTAADNRLPAESSSGGVEIFLVEGELGHGETILPVESWLRFPPRAEVNLVARVNSTVWLKAGHLKFGDVAVP